MEPEQANAVLAGNRADLQPSEAELTRVQSAQRAVEARAERTDSAAQSTTPLGDLPATLQPYLQELENDAAALSFLKGGWRPKIVDLRAVCAIQPVVYVEGLAERVGDIQTEDLEAIAKLTLPVGNTPLPAATFDRQQKAWILITPNPNVRVVAPIKTNVDAPGGAAGLGFAVSCPPSLMQVARLGGRLFLRDGYHRALSLLRSNIATVPALVREITSIDELVPPGTVGLLPPAGYLGPTPPLLTDYLDETVSASVSLPAQQKVIVIQALELKPTL
jgi:hypothetical protein